MKLATRATLKAINRKSVDVPITVSVNGSDVLEAQTFRLREMNGTERDKFEISAFKVENGVRVVDPLYLRARLVAMCLVDETGARMYSDDEIAVLSDDIPASVLADLFAAAQKLNGLEGDAAEVAAKNSVSAPTGASTSG